VKALKTSVELRVYKKDSRQPLTPSRPVEPA
jgi:hypothetical protein